MIVGAGMTQAIACPPNTGGRPVAAPRNGMCDVRALTFPVMTTSNYRWGDRIETVFEKNVPLEFVFKIQQLLFQ